MTPTAQQTASILREWADQGVAVSHPLQLSSGGSRAIVVSDLHVADGKREDGTYGGTENFFSDEAFARFLAYMDQGKRVPDESLLLVANGDVVDFVRITRVPSSDRDFQVWSDLLRAIGVALTPEELRKSIYDQEREFGLGTKPPKAVWKLATVAVGHPLLFAALAQWLKRGHRLVIVSGNHDVEWYWREVRDYTRALLASLADGDPADNLRSFLPRIGFGHDGVLIDGQYFAEHGHQYDRFTEVVGGPLLKDGTTLNLPFGSFFNRYLINRVELSYPYVDNVRPQKALLAFLVRHNFPLALKLLLYHAPLAIRVIPKFYFRYIFGRALSFLLAVGVPVVIAIVLIGRDLVTALTQFGETANRLAGVGGLLGNLLGSVAQNGLVVLASYLFSQLLALLQLREPSSLDEFARNRLRDNPGWRVVTMGHTHTPSILRAGNQQYLNSSTWTRVVETTSGDVRLECSHLYVLLDPLAQAKGLPAGGLERWDDTAGRSEQAAVVAKRRG